MTANKASSRIWPTRALLAVIIITLGYALYHVHEKSIKVENTKILKSTPPTVRHVIKQAGMSLPAAIVDRPRTPRVKVASYDHSIDIILWQHPDLKMSRKDAIALQIIYSAFWREKADFESGIATIVKQPNGTVVVTIPPYPMQAKEMLSELLGEVEVYYNNTAPSKLIKIISSNFAAYAADLGWNLQQLTIRAVYEPDRLAITPHYIVTQSVTIIDPTSGEVLSTSSGDFPVIDIEQSQYAGQEKFFPPLLSIDKQINR